jgi:thioredoxin reductase (NADPH)
VLTGADVPRERSWPLERDPFPLETSMPGVLAVGDARHGSIKRVASAVGEGSVAIRVLHRLLDPTAATRRAIDVTESPV